MQMVANRPSDSYNAPWLEISLDVKKTFTWTI